MAKGALISESMGTRVYLSDEPDRFIHEFRDEPVDYDGEEVPSFSSKPGHNLRITAALFRLLESNNFNTHFIRERGEREMETYKIKKFPVQVICRNVAAGSFADKTGLKEGEILPLTIIEFHLETDALKHIATDMRSHIYTEISDGEVKTMYSKALLANQVLKPFLYAKGLVLVDYKIEFGRDPSGRIRMGGSLCPDTCRLWDRETHEKIDKDRFRSPLRGTEQAHTEVLRRITAEN